LGGKSPRLEKPENDGERQKLKAKFRRKKNGGSEAVQRGDRGKSKDTARGRERQKRSATACMPAERLA